MSVQDGVNIIKEHIGRMEEKPGVYRMLSEAGDILYIGKAKNLPKRVVSYTKPKDLPYRLQMMISLTRSMQFTVTKNEAEALLLEATLIKELQPKYNILLKDGKTFPYILLTEEKEYNMMLKHRGKQVIKGKYFGPFLSGGLVNKTLSYLQKAFPLRTCTDNVFESRTKPCLEYQIKRCTAPCVNKITKEDYKKLEKEARDFLSGKTSVVQAELAQEMQKYADEMQYEKAGMFRDRIYALSKIQSESRLNMPPDTFLDAISFYKNGDRVAVQVQFVRGGLNYGNDCYFPSNLDDLEPTEMAESFIMQFYQSSPPPKTIICNIKTENTEVIEDALSIRSEYKVAIEFPQKGDKAELLKRGELAAKDALSKRLMENASQQKLLKLLAEEFKLEKIPKRIEVYDNSHIAGTNQVGAMIVVDENGFDKKSYRKFNIREAAASDDYGMMQEVLTRRFARVAEEGFALPDIVLIDGGKGQFNAAKQIFEDVGIQGVTLIALAKGEDRNAGNEEYFIEGREPFRLEKGSELAYFMQRIRDESHRFAITTHRNKRSKDLTKSALDQIDGIGATRKKALLHHFGSVDAIKKASLKDLQKVEGVSQKIAEIVYNYFN